MTWMNMMNTIINSNNDHIFWEESWNYIQESNNETNLPNKV